MPRARTVKPSFFTSEQVGALSPLARLLFVGLWTQADREGRLKDRPRELKIKILPYDDCSPETLLAEIEDQRLATRYAVEGEKYLQINGFKKHQRPHKLEPESTIPAEPDLSGEDHDESACFLVLGSGDLVPVTEKAADAAPVFPEVLDVPAFHAAWEDWFSYRRKAKFPKWQPQTIEAKLAELASWGPTRAVEAIRQSIGNGWRGVFEPKGNGGGRISPSIAATGQRLPVPPLDIRARLEALSAAIPPELADVRERVSNLTGDSESVTEALEAIDREVIAEHVSGTPRPDLSGLPERQTSEQYAMSIKRLREQATRKRIGLPVLSLFSPEAQPNA